MAHGLSTRLSIRAFIGLLQPMRRALMLLYRYSAACIWLDGFASFCMKEKKFPVTAGGTCALKFDYYILPPPINEEINVTGDTRKH